ncbi:MAG: T9SS type A sorting domain-containing protein [Bacteroidota bacterium]
MKTSILFRLIAGLFILIQLNTSLSQAQEISGFEVYPEHPTNADEILLVIHTTFPFLNCSLDSVNKFYACGAFSLDGFYSTNFTTGDCERTDTISLGLLSTGPYMISYRMYYLGWTQVDQADTFITVGAVGIEHLAKSSTAALKIWPNPSSGEVHISTEDDKIDKLHIQHISGLYSQSIDLEKENPNTINTVSLIPGMYICTTFSNDQAISMSKFIVVE